MFTLQILDRGQTFLHSIADRPLTLGSAPNDDVVLGEQGVAPAHARIEPHDAGARLVAREPVRVNGSPVRAAHDLALGDRVELGRAVVVVGRAVTRAASADDVLERALPRARRTAPARRRRAPRLLVLGGLVVAGALTWLAFGSDSVQRVNEQLALVQRLRTEGRTDAAAAAIARLQQTWAGAADDRLQRLDDEQRALAAIDVAAARLTAAVADPASERGYAEWSQELQRLEHEGSAAERVAARQVRGSLAETLRQRPKLAGSPRDTQAAPPAAQPAQPRSAPAGVAASPLAAAPQADGSSTGRPAAAAGAAGASRPEPGAAEPAATVVPATRVDPAEIDRLVAQGLFAQAIALLHAGLAGQADEAAVARLQQRAEHVRAQAREALARLLADAKRERADYGPREAAKLLHAARHRFPPTAEFESLAGDLAAYEALAAGAPAQPRPDAPAAAGPVDAATRAGTLAALRVTMDAVRRAEEDGAFSVAAQQLRIAADAVRDRDADFAARLQLRADEADLLAAWHDTVTAALVGGRTFAAKDEHGQPLSLVGYQGTHLRIAGDDRPRTWHDLGARVVVAVADQLAVTGRPALGAAALLYKQGENTRAEALLAKLVRADAGLGPAVDRVIARGRGEPFDPRGYTLGSDGFVAVRAVELRQQAVQLAQRVERALRDRDPAVRQKLRADTLAGGPEASGVLAAALRTEQRRLVAKLDTGSLKKQVDRVAAQRVLLDRAREHAKELIFDEKKYFYPYKPPAVASERYAEYARVQAEVDRRVAALRTVWQDERARVRVPSSLRAELDRLHWLEQTLASLGEADDDAMAQLGWVRALPPGDTITVRDYCATVAERAELVAWRRIDAYNQIVAKSLSAPQRELLQITNDYRAMFRHPPIAVVRALVDASQGHAEEMSRLGFFDHMSPTPGRRTPYDRMKLAGYLAGVSENIALFDGAMGAHVAWCHSSGHHRNLLDAANREIGVGAHGRYWVQNFGSGTAHRDDAAWPQSVATTR